MHFTYQIPSHFNGGFQAPMPSPHPYTINTTVWNGPVHNVLPQYVPTHFSPCPSHHPPFFWMPLPPPQPIQPPFHLQHPVGDSRGVNINGLMIYNVPAPVTPRKNNLCTLDHDHTSGCLMKSQDVRKQGALVKTAQETVKIIEKNINELSTVQKPVIVIIPAQPVPIIPKRTLTVMEQVEEKFPFLSDAKAVEAIRDKHPERFDVGIDSARIFEKHDEVEGKFKKCTQSLPSSMLKRRFMNKAILYNWEADCLRKKLQREEVRKLAAEKNAQEVKNSNETKPKTFVSSLAIVAQKVEEMFPFHSDAKAVESTRKRHPARFDIGIMKTRILYKDDIIEKRHMISTQSLPSSLLKKKFADKATRYNQSVENLRKTLSQKK